MTHHLGIRAGHLGNSDTSLGRAVVAVDVEDHGRPRGCQASYGVGGEDLVYMLVRVPDWKSMARGGIIGVRIRVSVSVANDWPRLRDTIDMCATPGTYIESATPAAGKVGGVDAKIGQV